MALEILDEIYALSPITGTIQSATVVKTPYMREGKTVIDVIIDDGAYNAVYCWILLDEIRSQYDYILQIASEVQS